MFLSVYLCPLLLINGWTNWCMYIILIVEYVCIIQVVIIMVGKTSNSEQIRGQMLKVNDSLGKTMKRIASGKKILSGSDDPAGLAVLMSMESQTRGITQQINIRQDEISMLQTAEGAMSGINDMLQRMNELSVQASNGTLTDGDREAIQFEIDQLSEQVNMTANNATYNTKPLLDGSLNVKLQSGDNLAINAMNSETLGLTKIDVTSQSGATSAIGQVSSSISSVSSSRGKLGAMQNGISHDIGNLNSQLISALNAQSRIGDADMAQEIINMSRDQLSSSVAIKAFRFEDESRMNVLNLLGD